MKTRVKICGLTTPDAFDAASGADWVGFNFVPGSPRHISPARAAALSIAGPPGPGRVGLFVDPADDDVATVLDLLPLAALQLYAPLARAKSLRARFGIPVWRAIGVRDAADLPTAPADRYVLDAAAPPGVALPGGNAAPFDWSLLAGWTAPAPWLLAGGLTPGNVIAAIAASGAPAVDVSSGVERSRGVKDPALIRDFIEAAHRFGS